ncbi:MAG: cytochrome-c peroxidase [Cyclobacteriaceae bacterium]|nr:cytochrome-c peroxidase [Cyclobacteriaceae bacterium]
MFRFYFFTVILALITLWSCHEEAPPPLSNTTPYEIVYPFVMEKYLPPIYIPSDNPMTEEGVALGRKLFYEEKLSGTGTISCNTCHLPASSYTNNQQFPTGHNGMQETRNTLVLVNLGWMSRNLWDGRAAGLYDHGFMPVNNPIELHDTWTNVMERLNADEEYVTLFKTAFGAETIDSTLVVKALNQFERTMISGNAPFDKHQAGEPTGWSEADFSAALRGFDIFMEETKGDCFHCHGDITNPLWTDNLFHNTGLDINPPDPGLGRITNNPNDIGKFKTPTLRNLVFTGPYMHDGRFGTLEEVVEFYSTGLQASPTIDPLMKRVSEGGVNLTTEEKADLVMFLKSLSDSSYTTNPAFLDPG